MGFSHRFTCIAPRGLTGICGVVIGVVLSFSCVVRLVLQSDMDSLDRYQGLHNM